MIDEYAMRRFSAEQLNQMQSTPQAGGLREEIAGLSKGDPRIYKEFMDMTAFDMWTVALGGM